MAVNNRHPDYIAKEAEWNLIDSVIGDTARDYIIPFEDYRIYPQNSPDYNRALRNAITYIEDGVLIPVTKRTRDNMVGMATNKPANIELSPALEYMLTDCTGNGKGLSHLCKEGLKETSSLGRWGILVDYPITDSQQMSKLDVELYGKVPRLYPYNARQIIGWRPEIRDGVEVITKVVLEEWVEDKTPGIDEFAYKLVKQWRVLRLDENNNYTVQIYDKGMQPGELVTVRGTDGQPLHEITFVFIGSEDNSPRPNSCPLRATANLNIAHYKNYCAHMSYIRIAGRGTLTVTSEHTNDEWEKYVGNQGIVMGSDKGYFLGRSGGMQYVQAPDTNAHSQSMSMIENQMIMCGADLLSANGQAKTAYEVYTNNLSRISPLQLMCDNMSAGITKALQYACLYMDNCNPDDCLFDLGDDLVPSDIDPNLMGQLITGIVNKIVPIKIVRDYWRKVKLIPDTVTDDELDEMIAEDETDGLSTPQSAQAPYNQNFNQAPVMADNMNTDNQSMDNNNVDQTVSN